MPVYDELAENGDEARQVLPSGESLLALTPLGPAYGATGPHDPEFRTSKAGRALLGHVRSTADAPRWLTRVGLVVAGLFSWAPSWSGPGPLFRRLLGGRVVEGPPGSVARAVQAELSPYGPSRYLAITDRQLHLLRAAPVFAKRSIAEDPPEWSAPRQVVANARRIPRLLSRARYELTFTDQSRIVLSQSPLHSGGWHATQVVTTLTQGNSEPDPPRPNGDDPTLKSIE